MSIHDCYVDMIDSRKIELKNTVPKNVSFYPNLSFSNVDLQRYTAVIVSPGLSPNEKSENNNHEQSIPVWIWTLLAFAVVGVSSAGTMFQQIDEIPPLLRASWRLQSTSLVLLPLAVLQWRWNCDASTRERCFKKSTILVLVRNFSLNIVESLLIGIVICNINHLLGVLRLRQN